VVNVGVVFLHGLRGSSSLWRHQVEAMRAAGHPALAPDLPGHGGRRGEAFTLGGATEAVEGAAQVLAAQGLEVLVVGQSLGGYVGLHWAARTSVPLRGVLAAACSTTPRGPVVEGYRLVASAIELLPDRGAWLNDRMASWTLPEEGARDAAAGALDHFRSQERAYARAAQNGRLVVVPRAKHLVSLEAPVAFTRLIFEMLDEWRPSGPLTSRPPGPRPAHHR
jgi:pimeloyl-ACP methyl ester carboxylesterase